MKLTLAVVFCIVLLSGPPNVIADPDNYLDYHSKANRAELLITKRSYEDALDIYQELFASYDFVFVREYKIATQIAWELGQKDKAFEYLREGIVGGWKMKSIKRNQFLRGLRRHPQWANIRGQYDSLRESYQLNLNQEMRAEVRKMSLRDQRKGMGALFRIGSKSQDRFGEKKFAPLNEKHVFRLIEIIEEDGFPGEKLVGFEPWGQGILARHNSISQAYCQADTLYDYLKPTLLNAVRKGNLSPASYAWIEDWFISVESGWSTGSYGLVNGLQANEIAKSNEMRKSVGMRDIETRNQLIDIQHETQMNFYLPPDPNKSKKILAK